ncbi:hypothetical protein MFIFM68171_00163 [Madurella fahalii]|uniref:Follistatin-like domain-containing protein n=1 Tax=Madurella fahalii TaxID=1157608 RepID=A0ABQ0FWS4_9PEZI
MLPLRLLAIGSILILQVVANPVGFSPRQQKQQQQQRATHSCATVRCPAGTRCVDSSGTARCVPIPAPQQDPRRRDDTAETGTTTACGPNVCASGQVCCNPSCGVCTAPGEPCTDEACVGPQCGPDPFFFCPLDQVCCNESCGKCAPPGTPCTMEGCLPPTPPPKLGPSCGNTTCAPGAARAGEAMWAGGVFGDGEML